MKESESHNQRQQKHGSMIHIKVEVSDWWIIYYKWEPLTGTRTHQIGGFYRIWLLYANIILVCESHMNNPPRCMLDTHLIIQLVLVPQKIYSQKASFRGLFLCQELFQKKTIDPDPFFMWPNVIISKYIILLFDLKILFLPPKLSLGPKAYSRFDICCQGK